MAHGIAYEKGESQSGVTLCGLGTGGLCIRADGSFADSTLQNNWTRPIEALLPGSFLAVHASTQAGRCTRILQSSAPSGVQPVDGLTYRGRFPFVEIEYHQLPVRVSLEAFCPFVPYDAKNSAIPAIVLTATVANPGDEAAECTLAMSWTNDVGAAEKAVANNFNAAAQGSALKGIVMGTRREDCARGHGYALAAVRSDEWQVSAAPEWNAATRGREFWDRFSESGELAQPTGPLDPTKDRRAPSRVPPSAAVAAHTRLAPGEERKVTFVLSWFMPNHYDVAGEFLGHMYANWFTDAWDVASYVHEHFAYLRSKSEEWQSLVYESSLPDAVKESCIAYGYIVALGSWWVKDGRFVLGECPGWLMEMAALRPYNMFACPMFFPELATKSTDALAAHQLDTGEIPSGLGNGCLNTPNYQSFRQQNSPSYVINVYLDYLWLGGREHLERRYESVKRAVEFTRTLDTDGDGLLNSYNVRETAWDTWPVVGTSVYVNQFWLVALRAAERMAEAMGDADFAAQCQQWGETACKNYEDQLWTGEYYAFYRDAKLGDFSSTCFVGQLHGQMLGYVLGLGDILPAEHVRKALDAIERLNVSDTRFGATSGVKPDGRRDLSSTANAQSHCVCPTEIFPYAAVCMFQGEAARGLSVVDKLWRFIVEHVRDPWRSLLLFDPDTGDNFYGKHYTDNLNVWALLLAAEGIAFDVAHGLLVLKPNLDPLTAPIFSPLFYGTMRYATRREGDQVVGLELGLTNLRPEPVHVSRFVTWFGARQVASLHLTSPEGEVTRPRFEHRPDGDLVVVDPLTFRPGASRITVEA